MKTDHFTRPLRGGYNTIDAIMLTWCSVLKNDRAYTILNAFWIVVGITGLIRSGAFAE